MLRKWGNVLRASTQYFSNPASGDHGVAGAAFAASHGGRLFNAVCIITSLGKPCCTSPIYSCCRGCICGQPRRPAFQIRGCGAGKLAGVGGAARGLQDTPRDRPAVRLGWGVVVCLGSTDVSAAARLPLRRPSHTHIWAAQLACCRCSRVLPPCWHLVLRFNFEGCRFGDLPQGIGAVQLAHC